MSKIQSIYALQSDGYTPSKLFKWIVNNGILPIKKYHILGNEIRFRIRDPNSKKKYITKILSNGIHLVIQI